MALFVILCKGLVMCLDMFFILNAQHNMCGFFANFGAYCKGLARNYMVSGN